MASFVYTKIARSHLLQDTIDEFLSSLAHESKGGYEYNLEHGVYWESIADSRSFTSIADGGFVNLRKASSDDGVDVFRQPFFPFEDSSGTATTKAFQANLGDSFDDIGRNLHLDTSIVAVVLGPPVALHTGQQIIQPSDVSGLRIAYEELGFGQDLPAIELLTGLGADMVSMDRYEIEQALSAGEIDGAFLALTDDETAKGIAEAFPYHLVFDGGLALAREAYGVGFAADDYFGVPDLDRSILEAEAAAFGENASEAFREMTQNEIYRLEDAGGTIVRLDHAQTQLWQDAAQSFRDQMTEDLENDGTPATRIMDDYVNALEGGFTTVMENAPGGTAVMSFGAEGDNADHVLLDDAGGRFTIDQDGVLRVSGGSDLDFEDIGRHFVTVRETIGGQIRDFEVEIALRNFPYRDIIMVTGGSVPEGTPPGTVVAEFMAVEQGLVDADLGFPPGLNFRSPYELVGNQLIVGDGEELDFENLSSKKAGVTADDGSNPTFVEDLYRIHLTDVREAWVPEYATTRGETEIGADANGPASIFDDIPPAIEAQLAPGHPAVGTIDHKNDVDVYDLGAIAEDVVVTLRLTDLTPDALPNEVGSLQFTFLDRDGGPPITYNAAPTAGQEYVFDIHIPETANYVLMIDAWRGGDNEPTPYSVSIEEKNYTNAAPTDIDATDPLIVPMFAQGGPERVVVNGDVIYFHGYLISDLVVSDPDFGDSHHFNIDHQNSDPESIYFYTTDSGGGELRVALTPGLQLAGAEIDLMLNVTDQAGGRFSELVTVRIEQPTGPPVIGTFENDDLSGTDSSEVVSAGAGDDVIRSSPGSDNIDGGPGNDRVIYSGERADYIPEITGFDTVELQKPDGSTDRLISIERIDLLDGDYVYDIGSDNLGFGYRIYQASFGRTPDEGGVRFWIGVLDALDNQGFTELGKQQYVASEFIGSDEFQGLYGANPTNFEYIDAMYQNVLFRLPDQEGYDFWVGGMEAGLSREDILIAFTQSQENISNNIANLDDGVWVV